MAGPAFIIGAGPGVGASTRAGSAAPGTPWASSTATAAGSVG